MKTGRITAKLRDAVPVCLMVEGKEVKRYKNIELPDSIKEVELLDFHGRGFNERAGKTMVPVMGFNGNRREVAGCPTKSLTPCRN